MSNQVRIKKLDLSDPEARMEFDRILADVSKQTQHMKDAIRKSRNITAKDLAVTINCTRPPK